MSVKRLNLLLVVLVILSSGRGLRVHTGTDSGAANRSAQGG